MRRRNSYSYKNSYGGRYYRSSYHGYVRKKGNPIKIVLICIAFALIAFVGAATCAYYGVFGDEFRFGKEEQQSSQKTVDIIKNETEENKIISSQPEKEIEGKWEENVFIYGNQGFEIFNSDDAAQKEYAKTVSSVRKQLDKNINVYSIIVPSHSYYGLPEKYKNLGSDEKQSIDNITALLDKEIKTVDIRATLEQHKKEYIYFGTDNNWTALGAYYAYKEFCKTAELTPTALNSLESGKINGFKGSLHAATITEKNPDGSKILDQNPDTVTYYKTEGYCRLLEYGESEDREVPMIAEFASGANAYSAFIWGNNPYMKIQTQLHTDRKLCIIKDSFGNAFAPFTAADFDEIFIANPAYYDGNIIDYIKKNNYTDVLILNSSSTANTIKRIDEMKTIL